MFYFSNNFLYFSQLLLIFSSSLIRFSSIFSFGLFWYSSFTLSRGVFIACVINEAFVLFYDLDSFTEIEKAIYNTMLYNPVKSKKSPWEKMSLFLERWNYNLGKDTSPDALAEILQDYSYNMRKEMKRIAEILV